MNKKLMEERKNLLKTYMSSLLNAVKIIDLIPIKPYWYYSNNNINITIDSREYKISFDYIDKNTTYYFTSDGDWVNRQGVKVSNLSFTDVKRVYDTSQWLINKLETKNTLI